MFDYSNVSRRVVRVVPTSAFGPCRNNVFRPSKDGVVHSYDTSADSGNFLDYSADRLVSAGVDVGESSKPFSDMTLNTLDDVDVNVSKVLDAEEIANSKIDNKDN